MLAIHAESIEKVLFHCHEIFGTFDVAGISKGPFNSSLIHGAIFGIDIDEFVLIDPVMSYNSLVSNRYYEPSFVPFAVAGQLEYYDLPDLVALFAPKKVKLINARDHLGDKAQSSVVEKQYSHVKNHFKNIDASENFSIYYGDNIREEIIIR